MPYDRARLRADFPDWHEPLANLVAGIAADVISVAEIERDIGRDSLSLFLRSYGIGVPITPLRDFLRRLRRLQVGAISQPATYHSLHSLAGRAKDPFWEHSVRLGRVSRREKFSWEQDPLGGIAGLHAYLDAVEGMCSRRNVECFTNYGRYVLVTELRINLPWPQLVNAARFRTLEEIDSAIERLPIEALDRVMLPIERSHQSQIKSLRDDHAALVDKMSNIRTSIRRSDLFAILKPTPSAQLALTTCRSAYGIDDSYAPERLHSTLLPLGCEEGRSAAEWRAIQRLLAEIALAPFDVTLDTLDGTLLRGACGSTGAAGLHRAVVRRLTTAGIGLPPYGFWLHLSLAYRGPHHPRTAIVPVTWRAEQFLLVRSVPAIGDRPGFHETVNAWPLVERQLGLAL